MLRTSCLLIGFTFGLAAGAAEPATRPATRPSPLVIPLWDHGVPNAPTTKPDPERDDGTRVWNVSVPAMLVYLPPQGDDHAAPRMAIVHCPAGGYTHLTRLAGADGFVDEFVPRGVAVIALKYRLRPASSGRTRRARRCGARDPTHPGQRQGVERRPAPRRARRRFGRGERGAQRRLAWSERRERPA
jgi:hypothetical protein